MSSHSVKKKIIQNCYKKLLSLQSKHTFDGFGRLYFNLRSMYYSIGKGKQTNKQKSPHN